MSPSKKIFLWMSFLWSKDKKEEKQRKEQEKKVGFGSKKIKDMPSAILV